MTEWNQLGRSLCRHYAGDARSRDGVALGEGVSLDRVQCVEAHRYRAFRISGTRGFRFSADIDHACTPFGVQVRKIAHRSVVDRSQISFEAMSCGLTLPSAYVCALRTASTALAAQSAADTSCL